jgi:hypothetical protein
VTEICELGANPKPTSVVAATPLFGTNSSLGCVSFSVSSGPITFPMGELRIDVNNDKDKRNSVNLRAFVMSDTSNNAFDMLSRKKDFCKGFLTYQLIR